MLVTTAEQLKSSVPELRAWLNHLSNSQPIDLRRAVAQEGIAVELLGGVRLVLESVLEVSLTYYETDNLSIRQRDVVTTSVAELARVGAQAAARLARSDGLRT